VEIRQAGLDDVREMQRLINSYAEEGRMLARSLGELYENVRDHFVAVEDGRVVGCAALAIVWDDLAEVKSLAVDRDLSGRGVGSRLVEACIAEARSMGVERIFVLTYVPQFFRRFGFAEVDRNQLPHKIWAECIKCPKFPECGEVPMVAEIGPRRAEK